MQRDHKKTAFPYERATRSGLSQEAELVRRLLDRRSSPRDERIVELLGAGLDLDSLLRYLASHRILPIVHRRLTEAYPGDISEHLAERLHQEARRIARFNLAATSELIAIVRLFGGAGIDLLPWKGPVLSQRLYGNVALRPFGDLDVVVRPGDVIRAGRLLRRAGYEPVVGVEPHQERPFVRYEHDRAYVKRENGLHLELHWRFFDRYISCSFDNQELWDRGSSVQLGGETLRLLPVEEELLILALHGAKHVWRSSGWLLDIDTLIRIAPPDWERLQELASGSGLMRVLSFALTLVEELYGAEPPGFVQRYIADDAMTGRLVAEVINGPLFRTRDEITVEDDPRFYLRCRERRSDRWHYLWFWMFTPNITDQNALRLPTWLSPLHYLIRPLRLLTRRLFRRT